MAGHIIPRDLSTPFDPADPVQIAEFEGFAATVPTTAGMIDFANDILVGAIRPFVPDPLDPDFQPQAVTRADAARVTRMFTPGFLRGVIAGIDPMRTPDVVGPSLVGATFSRKGIHDATLDVPGVGAVDMWSFQADVNRGVELDPAIGTWPASTIRVREGEIVHTLLGTRNGPHTIHHHGIEPTPANDGVGHLTFEVTGGDYTYQWRAAEAGTYFYHCHRNTVLHFEMGMYGMLIVDPNVPGAPFVDGGSGAILVRDTPTAYDREAIWVADDIDDNYRTHAVDAGIQGVDTDGRNGFVRWEDPDNPRLNAFNPTYFVVSGQAPPLTVGDEQNTGNLIPDAGATLTLGQKLLVRALNASYCTTVWKFPTSLQGLVTAQDGRTLGRSRFGSYSEPFTLASIGHQFTFTTAQRYDILIDTAGVAPGQHLVEIEFRHWIHNLLLRTVRVPINVSSQA